LFGWSWRFRKSNSSTFKDLQTQIQGLSRTTSVFKDFPRLENLEKKFKDFQGPATALSLGYFSRTFQVLEFSVKKPRLSRRHGNPVTRISTVRMTKLRSSHVKMFYSWHKPAVNTACGLRQTNTY